MIHRDDMTRAGHVLDDETGIARNMPAHVIDDQAGPKVVKISRRRADDDADGFALIKRRLGVGADGQK
jgi:hypothetical protein